MAVQSPKSIIFSHIKLNYRKISMGTPWFFYIARKVLGQYTIYIKTRKMTFISGYENSNFPSKFCIFPLKHVYYSERAMRSTYVNSSKIRLVRYTFFGWNTIVTSKRNICESMSKLTFNFSGVPNPLKWPFA